MMICRLTNDLHSNNADLFSGHFLLSSASEDSFLLRSVASNELFLPTQKRNRHKPKFNENQMDQTLTQSLTKVC